MINKIDFTKNGGYRFKQFTLRKMQEAYEAILKAFISFCNVPETGSFIISGMKISGENITAGYAYIDGELCKFEQTAGTVDTKIKKNVVIQSLGFKNGNNENVFRFVNAQVDPTGVKLSEFTRVSPVFDANYVHTDNNFTSALQTKLEGIEDGAEVNVQADWNVSNPDSDAFIKNKPTGIFQKIERVTLLSLTDINGTASVTVPIPDMGTTNYIVVPSIETGSTNDATARNNASFQYTVFDKQATSFKFAVREFASQSQSPKIEFLILVK